METVSSYFGTREPQHYGRQTKSAILTGIEIEIENVIDDLEGSYPWKCIKDGSLRNKGKEFTLCVWNTSAELYLKRLFKIIPNAEVSSRCSVHVHVNINSFTKDQIKSLILLYIVFEKALYRYSGKRWDNIYCVPVRTWAIALQLDHLDILGIQKAFPKYSGLNIIPEQNGMYLGTVEFRQMVGNKNVLYISTWIEILTQLVQYAEKQDYTELKKSLFNMRLSSEYWQLFQNIFKHNAGALNYTSFDKDVEEGITFTKLITD